MRVNSSPLRFLSPVLNNHRYKKENGLSTVFCHELWLTTSIFNSEFMAQSLAFDHNPPEQIGRPLPKKNSFHLKRPLNSTTQDIRQASTCRLHYPLRLVSFRVGSVASSNFLQNFSKSLKLLTANLRRNHIWVICRGNMATLSLAHSFNVQHVSRWEVAKNWNPHEFYTQQTCFRRQSSEQTILHTSGKVPLQEHKLNNKTRQTHITSRYQSLYTDYR